MNLNRFVLFCSKRSFLRQIPLSCNISKHNLSTASVRIVEVGPRDGLQNETEIVPTNIKIDFINKLSETGLKTIEVTSFVSPKWVPQMSDNVDVFKGIDKKPDISYPVLVPNLTGLKTAISSGVKEIAVFGSASDSFSKKNVNCSAMEALDKIEVVTEEAKKHDLKIRGYVSCVVGCPYEGDIKPYAVTKMVEELLKLGCYEISLGDTIGVGTKSKMQAMLEDVLKVTDASKLAIHCHDTYGQALPNICTSMDYDITVIDSSVSGLGGCPYARGASGNVSTEDLVYMLHGMGVETGLDLPKLVEIGQFISGVIRKPTSSRVNKALYKKL